MNDGRFELRSSFSKTASGLFFSLAFVAISFEDRFVVEEWFLACSGRIFFGLCALASLYSLIRRSRLVLNDDGLIVDHRFRAPKHYAWKDIDRFCIYHPARGAKAIGLKFRPNSARKVAAWRASLPGLPDGTIPDIWSMPPQDMVDLLDRWLVRSREDPATSKWRETNRVADEPSVW